MTELAHSPSNRLAKPAGLGRWLTKEEREQLAKPEAARLALERAIGPTDATPHVSAWLKTVANPNTRRGYAIDCLAFIDWVRDKTGIADEPINLSGVSDLTIAEYVEHIREAHSPTTGKPLSVASQARRLSALSVMFRYLKRKGHIPANPLLELERPEVSREGMTAALTMPDVDKLLAAARESPYDPARDLALIAALSVQAVRVSEIMGADVTDMSTERGRRMLRVKMKRSKQVKIPLEAPVVALIDTHVGERVTGPLLLNNQGGRLHPDQARRIVARLGRAAGIGRVTPHMLRTTAITELLERGTPQHQVQHMVRHASGDTTGRYWRRRTGVEQDAALTATLAAALPSLTAVVVSEGTPTLDTAPVS